MKKLSAISNRLSDPRVGGERRFYFSFAGGGAKGIVHIGALRFIERNGYNISGLAGTSAGAIVATLKAIGYSSDEILSESGGSRLFKDLAETRACKRAFPRGISNISDLFGDGLVRLKSLRENSRKGRYFRVLLSVLGVAPEIKKLIEFFVVLVLMFVLSVLSIFYLSFDFVIVSLSVCVLLLLSTKEFLYAPWVDLGSRLRLGLVDIEIFKNVFDELICRKIGIDRGRRAKFVDLKFDLRIIATDLSRGEPILFSAIHTPDAFISDAICASMSLPYFFPQQSVKIRQSDATGTPVSDGGLVSNLPVWVFGPEVELNKSSKVIAINISERKRAPTSVRKSGQREDFIKQSVSAVVRSVREGAERINISENHYAREMVIPTTLKILDFDARTEKRSRALKQGEKAVYNLLHLNHQQPAEFSSLCSLIRDRVAVVLRELYLESGANRRIHKKNLRVSLATLTKGRPDIISLKFSAGFFSRSNLKRMWIPHSDLALVLPTKRSIAGQSILQNRVMFEYISESNPGYLDFTLDHDLLAKVREDIKWVMAIPFRVQRPNGEIIDFSFSIDGTQYFCDIQNEPVRDKMIERLSEDLYDFIELTLADLYGMNNSPIYFPDPEACDEAHSI